MNARQIFLRLWHYLTGSQRLTLSLVAAGNVVTAFALTAPTLLIGDIVSRLTAVPPRSPLRLVVLIVVLFAVFAVLRVAIHIALHEVLPRIEVVFRYTQVEHALKTPIQSQAKEYASELNALMGNGTKAASDLLKIYFGQYMPAVLQVVWAIALAAHVNLLAGLLMAAAAPASYFITRQQLRSQNGVRITIARAKARLDGVMTELLKGKPIVRTLNAVDVEAYRVRDQALELSAYERRHHRAMGAFDGLKMASESLFGVAIILYTVFLVQHRSFAPGEVLALYLLYTQFSVPLREIHRMRDEANEAEGQIEIMLERLSMPVDRFFDKASETTKDSASQTIVSVEDLAVTYPGHNIPAVRNFQMSVQRGQFVGLCGPAGSGKSTVVKCIAGLIPSSTRQGRVSLFGMDIDDWTASSFATTVAYASQETYILAATIRVNLSFGLDRKVSDEDLWDALRDAHLDKEIRRIPEQLDKVLGEEGQGLSGGQRQRLILARLLLRSPQLLILDEATAALDNVNEAAVMGTLESRGITLIAIAHRLTTLRNADIIYVMEEGCTVQHGTFEQLAGTEGLFRKLLEAGEPTGATAMVENPA